MPVPNLLRAVARFFNSSKRAFSSGMPPSLPWMLLTSITLFVEATFFLFAIVVFLLCFRVRKDFLKPGALPKFHRKWM